MPTNSNTNSDVKSQAKTTRSNARRTATSARRTATAARRQTAASARATTRKADTKTRRATGASGSNQPRTTVGQVTDIAERVVLVPFGASLIARDDIVSTVKDLASKYTTRTGIQRELKRYERRGVTARNRLERGVKRQRTQFERELRQRRTAVERTVKQNRARVERDARRISRDFGKLVTDAQGIVS